MINPGNRGAAVVTGLNVIVFSIIGALAYREKKQKERALVNSVLNLLQ
jgi:hypothetical protein